MRTIIFDFDGTMADTLATVVAIYNRVGPTYGCRPVATAELPELRKQRPRELMRRFNVRFFNLPWLLRAMRRELQLRMNAVPPQPHVLETITALHARGYTIGLLSSNTEQNVRTFLEQHDVSSLFSFVVSYKNLFGKDRAFRRLLKARKLAKDDVVYVGDETRDIEAAHRAGICVVAVGWGFNAKEALLALKPDAFVERQEDLLSTLQQLGQSPSAQS